MQSWTAITIGASENAATVLEISAQRGSLFEISAGQLDETPE